MRTGGVLLLLSTFLPSTVLGLTVNLSGPSDPVPPKSVVSVRVAVDGILPEDLEVTLPEGWQLLSPPTMQSPLLNIAIPASAAADTAHLVTVTVTDSNGTPATASQEIYVAGRQAAAIELVPLQTRVWAGEQRELQVRVRNRGNQAAVWDLQAERLIDGWEVEPRRSPVKLEAGEVTTVSVRIRAPLDSGREQPGRFRVSLLDGDTVLRQKRLSLLAVPLPPSQGKGYPTMGTRLGIKLLDLGEGGGPRTRVAIYSSGALTENQTLTVDYQDTYFNSSDDGSSGSDQYYKVHLEDQRGWVLEGGHTEARFRSFARDLSGEGVRFLYDQPKQQLLLFYARNPRPTPEGLKEWSSAANAIRYFNKQSYLEGTYQFFDERDATGTPTLRQRQIGQSELRWQITPRLWTAAEGAVSQKENPASKLVDHAYRAELNYSHRYVSLHGQYRRAGTDFPGRITDEEGYRVFANSRWEGPITLWAKHRALRDNVNRIGGVPTTFKRQYSLGSYLRDYGQWPALGLIVDWTKYRSTSTADADHESNVQVSGTWHKGWGRYHLSGRSRWEWITNALSGDAGTVSDTYANLQTQWKGADISLRARLQVASVSTRNPRLASYRGTLQYPIGPGYALGKAKIEKRKTTDAVSTYTRTLEAGYVLQHKSWYGDMRFQDKLIIGDPAEGGGNGRRMRLRGYVGYALTDSQTLEAHVDWDKTRGSADQFRVSLSWTTHFGLPLPFLRTQSEVYGRVYSADGRGYSMVPVELDQQRAYTDEEGRYRFVPVSPGEYQLDVETAELPSTWSVAGELPRTVTVVRGEQVEEDIILEATPEAVPVESEDLEPVERELEITQFEAVEL